MYGVVVSLKAFQVADPLVREKTPEGPEKEAVVKAFDAHKEGGSRAAFDVEPDVLEWLKAQFDAILPTVDSANLRVLTTFRSDMDKPVDLANRRARQPRDPNAPKPERKPRGGGRRAAGVPPVQFKAKEQPWFPLAEPNEGEMITSLDFELPAAANGAARQFSGFFLEGKLVRLRAHHLNHDTNYAYEEAESPTEDDQLVAIAEAQEQWYRENVGTVPVPGPAETEAEAEPVVTAG